MFDPDSYNSLADMRAFVDAEHEQLDSASAAYLDSGITYTGSQEFWRTPTAAQYVRSSIVEPYEHIASIKAEMETTSDKARLNQLEGELSDWRFLAAHNGDVQATEEGASWKKRLIAIAKRETGE